MDNMKKILKRIFKIPKIALWVIFVILILSDIIVYFSSTAAIPVVITISDFRELAYHGFLTIVCSIVLLIFSEIEKKTT